ncbi:MAG: hypothetical protein V4671_02855 [Armatimonadota bacterium]
MNRKTWLDKLSRLTELTGSNESKELLVTTTDHSQVRQPFPSSAEERAAGPNPDWIRGKCPTCGDYLVSNFYAVKTAETPETPETPDTAENTHTQEGCNYILIWECWSSLPAPGTAPTCDYRRVL